MGRQDGTTFAALAAAALGLLASPAARADGAVPFYGYSGYFGGPAVYYTAAPDVHQTTRPVEGSLGFGVATYTTGGPFWGYKPVHAYPAGLRRYRREHVLRVRG